MATLGTVFSRRMRLTLSLLALSEFALLLGFAWARFSNVHQRTFDLALYARIAWGFAHGDHWASIVDAPSLGCHLAPVLWPLGWLGRFFGTVPVLLVAQAASIALTVFPLARIGARRLGTRGVWLSLVAFLLYPNLFHVGTYEFHPGTLAVLPMTWAFDALDRKRIDQLGWACLAVLSCREDLGAFCVLIALVYYVQQRDRRALSLGVASLAYTAIAVAIVCANAPKHGSLDAHFAQWGGSPVGVVRVLFEDPARVGAHFRERLSYLPRVLAPLSFFSLRAPLFLLPALPFLALNLLSEFHTADETYSHYLTPAVPALIVSGVVGVTAVSKRFLRMLWFATLGIAHHAFGGSPLSRDFDRRAYLADAHTLAARKVLRAIPASMSVQAPDALLPHLAERRVVRRGPPPEAGSAFTVLDISHRERYARREDMLRTIEEPLVRRWLTRSDQTLRVYAPPYALLERVRTDAGRTEKHDMSAPGRGTEPGPTSELRTAPPSGPPWRCVSRPGSPANAAARPLTRCLAVESGLLRGDTLTVLLRAQGPCAADLALRFGPDPMPARVELLCDGAVSPARLRAGDAIRSMHKVTPREAGALRQRGLFLGTLRASGAPAEPGDPAAIPIHLQLEGT